MGNIFVMNKRKTKMPTIRITDKNFENLKQMALNETARRQEPVGTAEYLNEMLEKELPKKIEKFDKTGK